MTLLFMNHFSRKTKRINHDKTKKVELHKDNKGHGLKRALRTWLRKKKGRGNLCNLKPRLNVSIISLLALVIAGQHGPG